MMRITFILAHAVLSGGDRVLANYAQRLQSRGHTVNVISTPLPKQTWRDWARALRRSSDWRSSIKMPPSFFQGADVKHHIIDATRPIVDSDVPPGDVVIATYWKTAQWVADLSPEKGVKAFFLQGYETSPGREDPEIDTAWRLPLNKIVVSRSLAEFAKQRFGAQYLKVVPNSVDFSQFNSSVRSKQNIPTVGLLYHTLHWKGVDVCIEAIKRVMVKLPGTRVLSFGQMPQDRVLPLPDGTEFFFRPHQDSLKQIYSQCDVWVAGSRREGFGLSLLEAMACRCPVVSTKTGAAVDLIQNGINGYLVDVDDVKNLACQIYNILTLREESWIEMSSASHETAGAYTWDDATNLFESALYHFVKNTT